MAKFVVRNVRQARALPGEINKHLAAPRRSIPSFAHGESMENPVCRRCASKPDARFCRHIWASCQVFVQPDARSHDVSWLQTRDGSCSDVFRAIYKPKMERICAVHGFTQPEFGARHRPELLRSAERQLTTQRFENNLIRRALHRRIGNPNYAMPRRRATSGRSTACSSRRLASPDVKFGHIRR